MVVSLAQLYSEKICHVVSTTLYRYVEIHAHTLCVKEISQDYFCDKFVK